MGLYGWNLACSQVWMAMPLFQAIIEIKPLTVFRFAIENRMGALDARTTHSWSPSASPLLDTFMAIELMPITP